MLDWNGSSSQDRHVYPYLYQLLAVSVHVNMHVWILTMTGVEITTRGIRDEEIHDSAPMVRALLVERLEQIWSVCEPHVTGTMGKPDPRFVEAGIRVLDRLARLYRLDQPVPASNEVTGDLISQRDLVLAGLRDLEIRMQDPLG
jgi:hypothetical protein